MSKRIVGAGLIGVLLIGGLVYTGLSLEVVKPGYAGIVYSLNGGVEEDTLGQGMHFVAPTKKVINYPVSTETMYLSRDVKEGSKEDDSFPVISKGGKSVQVDAELSYRYNEEQLHHVFTKWRGKKPNDIEDTFIRARIKDACNKITSQYDVLDIYGEQLPNINLKIFDELKAVLEKDGIVLETFALTNVTPDEQTKVAIQAKVDAQQKLEQDKIEAERQAIQNQKDIDRKIAEQEQANIENQERNKRVLENANAEAEATLKKAQAEAEANRLINSSLTQSVLDLKEIEAWASGGAQVPQVQGAGSNIIDFRK